MTDAPPITDSLAEALADAEYELAQTSADAATVVYAFDRAAQLNELLVGFGPPGQPMHPNILAAKECFDQALAAMHRPVPPADQQKVDALAGKFGEMADTLQKALILIDNCLNEVARLPNLSLSIIVARDNLKASMERLLKGQQ